MQEIIDLHYNSRMFFMIHKFSSSNRIIFLCNSLPDYVVSSPTTNTFKVDTGNRSKVELANWLNYLFLDIRDCELFLHNRLDIEDNQLIYTTSTTTT